MNYSNQNIIVELFQYLLLVESKDMVIKRWDMRVGENVAISKVQDS